jgi:hypothetical protein
MNKSEKKINGIESEKTITEYISEILNESGFCGAGAEGIVYRLDSEFIPAGFLDKLKKMGVDVGGSIASKILKVYTKGTGLAEFEALQKANRILSEVKEKEELAKVPTPIFFQEVEMSESLRAKLGDRGNGLDDKAEVLLMDYVPGTDLASLFYREALKILQKDRYDEKSASELDHDSLVREVELELSESGMPPIDKERSSSLGDDAKWLAKFLKNSGYVPDEKIISQLKKTVDVFNKNGLTHGDLHAQNVLFDGEQAYIIDFGKAGGRWENMTSEEKEERVNDNTFIKWLEEFASDPEKKSDLRAQKYFDSIKKMGAKTKILDRYNLFKNRIADDPSKTFSEMFGALSMVDDKIDEFCALIILAYNDNPENSELIKDFLKNKIASETGSVVDKFQMLNQELS